METNRGLFKAQTANKSLTRADLSQFCEVQRWLESKKESTKHVYLHALSAFIEYTKLSPKELIDLAEEDLKKSQRERGEPSRKVLAFYNWLTNGYTRKLHRKNHVDKQLSRNLANTYSQAIKGFFGDNGFPLSVKIPKPIGRKENFKPEPPRIPEVKRLIDATTCLRDKAIILTLFQSGMSLNELCHLTYGDVGKGIWRIKSDCWSELL